MPANPRSGASLHAKVMRALRSLGWKRYMRTEFADADLMARFIGVKGLGDEYLAWAIIEQAKVEELLRDV